MWTPNQLPKGLITLIDLLTFESKKSSLIFSSKKAQKCDTAEKSSPSIKLVSKKEAITPNEKKSRTPQADRKRNDPAEKK